MWILTLLLMIFILGIIILVHELGHFFWAKKFGVHIYEFSIGMGPILHTHKGKDKIDYNIRAIPIGGFVAMAGEVYEDAKNIKKEDFMCNKPWLQRVIILIAGVMNNFLLALILLFVTALIWGSTVLKPVVDEVLLDYPMAEAGIVSGDTIVAINGHKTKTWDVAQIVLVMKNKNDYTEFVVRHKDNTIDTYKVTPIEVKDEETGEKRTMYGMSVKADEQKGFVPAVKYAFSKFGSIVHSMWLTIGGLINGKISMKALSGPVGIYQVVDESVGYGLDYILYLVAFLSLNVGFINILPFPAFDGGHVLFLIIEKIKGSPVNQKFENICHTIGFFLLILLMIYITIQDIIRIV